MWLPEQHFFDYCVCPDALDLAHYVVGVTSRVRVGTAVVNLSLTHPLRFAERAAMLDLISGGRVDICVGRGYQLPQNVAFGVAEEQTKPMFAEALDIVLNTWDTGPRGYDGAHYSFPPVRTYPLPQRPANEILLYGVGGTTPVEETIRRGLPLALSQPFGPVAKTAEAFAELRHRAARLVLERAGDRTAPGSRFRPGLCVCRAYCSRGARYFKEALRVADV